MKRTGLLLSCLCFAFMLSAQSQSIGLQLGFSEPYLRSNITSKTSKLNNNVVTNGFKAGFVYDATLVKGFGMNIALNYTFSFKQGKWQPENQLYKNKEQRTTIMTHTIELPIEWQYKFKIATDTWLIAYTGPVLQYNFSFIEKTYHRGDPIKGNWAEPTKYHYKTDNDIDGKPDFSPFNIQWGVGGGFQYQNYYIRGGYNFGIYNHFRDNYNGSGDYSNRARYDEWNIRVGIYFLNF